MLYYLKIMIIQNGKGLGFRMSKGKSWMFSLACTEFGTAHSKLVGILLSMQVRSLDAKHRNPNCLISDGKEGASEETSTAWVVEESRRTLPAWSSCTHMHMHTWIIHGY